MNKIAPLFKFGRATSKRATKINVAYIALAPFISGSERSLQVMLTNSAKEEINPLLICPPDSPMLNWAVNNHIDFAECSLIVYSHKNIITWLRSQWALFCILRNHKIKIVHSNQIWSYPTIVLAARLARCKTICHLRDPVEQSINWWLKTPPDIIIAVSQHILVEFKKTYKQFANVKSAYALINPVLIPPKMTVEERNAIANKAKHKFGYSTSLMIFGYVGQISSVKGIIEMLDILSNIERKDWKLLIAGIDPDPSQQHLIECVNKIRQLNLEEQVCFIGYQQETQSFYHAVDCVLMFSKREPLGRVPLEAGAHYTTTIATNIDGLPETIVHAKSGFLVDMDKPSEILSLLDNLTKQQTKNLGARARQFVEESANPSCYVVKLRAIYDECCNVNGV
jgi:glycosyltransferase involved in cell wall biosynthesis